MLQKRVKEESRLCGNKSFRGRLAEAELCNVPKIEGSSRRRKGTQKTMRKGFAEGRVTSTGLK